MAKYYVGGGKSKDSFDFIDDKFSPKTIDEFLSKKKLEIDKGLRDSWNKEYKRVHPDRISSLTLMQSLGVNVKRSPNYISLIVTAEDYWKFVDKGVKGRLSTINAPKSPFRFKKKNLPKEVRKTIVKDSRLKGIKGDKQADGVGYLIGRKITAEGIKPIPFATNYFTDKFKEGFINDVRDFMING